MKKLGKFPIEIFCYDYQNKTAQFDSAIKQQYCKYIKTTCVKPRKSEPHIKVGICTLGSTVNNDNIFKPIIICPQRFKGEEMFEAIRMQYLSNWKNVKWIQEVNIGVGGNIDYVAIEIDEKDNIKDFLCIEIQAAGTTGSPYPAVKEFLQTREFHSYSYKYGINWANEFSKTMMQQAYKKGKIVQSWNRKIVFIIQDVALEYLYKATDCSELNESNPILPVDFCTFSLDWDIHAELWKLNFQEIKSTSIEGINRILGGAHISEYLTEQEFIKNIIRKGVQDKILTS